MNDETNNFIDILSFRIFIDTKAEHGFARTVGIYLSYFFFSGYFIAFFDILVLVKVLFVAK